MEWDWKHRTIDVLDRLYWMEWIETHDYEIIIQEIKSINDEVESESGFSNNGLDLFETRRILVLLFHLVLFSCFCFLSCFFFGWQLCQDSCSVAGSQMTLC